MRFEGKNAIVTGGSNGIGRACVAQLVGEGGRVALVDFCRRGPRGAQVDRLEQLEEAPTGEFRGFQVRP